MQIQNANSAKPNKKVSIADIGITDLSTKKHVQIGKAMIEIITILPYEKLLDTLQLAVTLIIDDRAYVNIPLEHIVTELSILAAYTNIELPIFDDLDFTAERAYETYDILFAADAFGKVAAQIDKKQLEFYRKTLKATTDSILEYRNSTAGVFERLTTSAKADSNQFESVLSSLEDEKKMGVAYKLLHMMGQDGNSETIDMQAIQELAASIKVD